MSDTAQDEANKAIAAIYNAQNPTGGSDEENAARLAAADLDKHQGSETHAGTPEVRADTPEELAAAAEAKVAKDAADKVVADAEAAKAAAAAETPEDKAKREAATPKAEEPAKGEWLVTENKSLNAAVNMMKTAGLTPDAAAAIFNGATETGDVSKVDNAALVAAVGADAASLILSGVTQYITEEGAALLAKVSQVHDAVGGKESFTTIQAWAKTKAATDTDFKSTVENLTVMLNGDNAFQSTMAAKELVSLYNGDANNSTLNANTALNPAGAPVAPPAPVPAITAKEYAEGCMAASKNLRGADQQNEMARLSRGRAAGRTKGI